jgi:hypothetical protein
MSIEDGLAFMELISRAELMKGYNEKKEFLDYDSSIQFKLISVQDVKEIKLKSIIEPEEESTNGN